MGLPVGHPRAVHSLGHAPETIGGREDRPVGAVSDVDTQLRPSTSSRVRHSPVSCVPHIDNLTVESLCLTSYSRTQSSPGGQVSPPGDRVERDGFQPMTQASPFEDDPARGRIADQQLALAGLEAVTQILLRPTRSDLRRG